MNEERKLALFIDFENIARGVKEAQYKAFEIKLVLERLVEKGKIMVRRAYADWNRFVEYKRPFHENAIELIDVPQSRYSGKNSARYELYYGYSTFSRLVGEAAKQKIVTLERDEKSGTYIITALSEEGRAG